MIERVSKCFVPAAVNLYKVRNAKDAGGELFRSVQKQKDQYQGIWIIDPDGTVLAGHHEIKNQATWAQEVLETMDVALKAFGAVTPREVLPENPLPYRGIGIRPDGSVSLALYARYVHEGNRDGPPVVDSLSLSAEEWSRMSPATIRDGFQWTIPESVARKLCRALSPNSDQSTMPQPNEVAESGIKGTVTRATSETVELTYSGAIAAAHQYEGKISYSQAQLYGYGVLDAKTHRLRLLRILFEGTYRHFPPYDSPRQTAAVIEWQLIPRRDR